MLTASFKELAVATAILAAVSTDSSWGSGCFAQTRLWDENCPAPDYESVTSCADRTNCSEHIDHSWQASSFAGSWGRTFGTTLYHNLDAPVQGLVQYTERAVQARATPDPNTLVLTQADAPGILVRYVHGAYADMAERQCMTRYLATAIASIPLIVVRALPVGVVVNVDGSLGRGEAFARKTSEGGYEIDLEPFWFSTCQQRDWRDRQTTPLEEVLIHEFAHVLDWKFGVTRHLGGGKHHGRFWTKVHTQGKPDETAFVTCYASKDEGEHFAESLGVWLAYRSGAIGGSANPARIQEDMYVWSKMCRELRWWDRQAVKAAASVHGAFDLAPRPRTLDEIHAPSDEGVGESIVFDSFFPKSAP